jgi:hypothetical protein
MSEKPARPKKASAKTSKDDAGVLGSLPATRATRVGGDRTRSTAAKPKAPASKPKPKAAAKPRTAAKPKAAANPAPQPATPHRPRPVRAGAPALKELTERTRFETPEPRAANSGPPTGTELVTTAIQAAGELAQIGFTVGGQVLKRAVKRLPKP